MKFLRVLLMAIAGICIFSVEQDSLAQESGLTWFPREGIFPVFDYDLLETQSYAGFFALNASNVEYNGVYIPVNLGFRKSILQWGGISRQFSMAFGAASFTQFEIARFDKNTLRGGLLNSDFKASGYLFMSQSVHKFRLQVFHISSHLGDDYLIRNQDFRSNDKSVNYEQVDLTYLVMFDNAGIYLGLGEVYSPNTYRKRFMAQCGFQGDRPIKNNKALSYGSDVKFYEENGFLPDIHFGAGITFKKEGVDQFNASLDGYRGNLPYSTLDFGVVFWFGLSTKLFL